MSQPKSYTPLDQRSQSFVDAKRQARMTRIDSMPQDVRALIHDYGFNTINAMLDCGVTKPRQIRHLVETVLNEFSPTRGSYSAQGPRSDLTRMSD